MMSLLLSKWREEEKRVEARGAGESRRTKKKRRKEKAKKTRTNKKERRRRTEEEKEEMKWKIRRREKLEEKDGMENQVLKREREDYSPLSLPSLTPLSFLRTACRLDSVAIVEELTDEHLNDPKNIWGSFFALENDYTEDHHHGMKEELKKM